MNTRLNKITSKEKSIHFSDIFTNFNAHPETGYLMRNTDANSVKASIRNLIMTNKGERFFQPDVGCDVRKALFEFVDDTISENMLRTYISDAIAQNEPRAKVIEILIAGYAEENMVKVSIVFEIIDNTTPQVLNLTLYRVR